MDKSAGQKLLERIEAYITRYVAFPVEPENQSLVLALWAVHTWMYERFPVTPRLSITANVKEAGKTLCMEVLALVSRGSHLLATLRPLALLRVIKVYEGCVTLFIDEAEKLSSGAIGDLRSIFASGYARGGQHIITKGEEFSKFQTFAPAAFALIGDVMDVVHSRSIVARLDRAEPKADFRGNRAEAEAIAAGLVTSLLAYFTPARMADLQLVQPAFLKGRERELWTPIFSIAQLLNLDKATIERLTRAAVDMAGLKHSTERRKYSSAADEEKATTAVFAEQALKDLAYVLDTPSRTHTGDIHSAEAVARMKAIPAGQWRTFKGIGLTADMLAGLVKQFGVHTKVVRMVKGRGGKTLNGYKRSDVLASVPSVERRGVEDDSEIGAE